MKRSSFDVT